MGDLGDKGYFEKLTLGVVKSLGTRIGIVDVKFHEKPPTEKHHILHWEQKYSCLMPDDLKNFYLTSNGFILTWSVKINESKVPVGRMEINDIDMLTRIGGTTGSSDNLPTLTDIDLDYTDSAEEIRPRFDHRSRIFELDPCDGHGKVCLVYNNTKPGIPAQTASIWFMDRALCWHHLADSFLSYYRLLITNIGLPQWQYTFTDIGLCPQAKQWFHMYAPLRLDAGSLEAESEANNTINNTLDIGKVFKGKSDKKKPGQQQQLGQRKKPLTATSRNPAAVRGFPSNQIKTATK